MTPKTTIYTRDFASAFAASTDSEAKSFRATLATDAVARDNNRILSWDLTNNNKTGCSVLWAHDVRTPPPARAINLRARGGNLTADIVFPEPGAYELSDTLRALIASGFLRAMSVSWTPGQIKRATESGRAPGALDFYNCDLHEASIVPVPADPNALIAARSRGIDTKSLHDWATRALDERQSPVPRQHLEIIQRETKMPVTPFRTRAEREQRAAQLSAEVGMEHTGFRSFGEFLQAVANSDASIQDGHLTRAPAGANEGNPSAGGFLVPEVFSDQLVASIYESSVLANLCDRRLTSQPLAAHRIPAVDETSRADGSRWGGTASFWANEADSVSASAPRYRLIELSAHKLTAVSIASSELLADAALLEGAVRRAFTRELSFKLDTAILRGTGVGQPLGVLNSPATIVVPKETGQASGTIVAENIDNMWSRLPGPSRRSAVWLINEDGEAHLSKTAYVVGTAGVPLSLYPSSEGAPVLKARPLYSIEQASGLGALGDIILCDLSQFILLDGGLQFALSIHAQFDSDQVVYRITWRIDGAPAWASPITAYNGTGTRSPYVTLAAR